MKNKQLAQLNIASLSAPIDSPALADFVAQLDSMNTLADNSPGFVWRLQADTEDDTQFKLIFGENIIINMSVWTSIDDLHAYTYRSDHAQVMSKRANWFDRIKDDYSVLWWVPAGHRPTLAEAAKKLQSLRSRGPSPEAFTFKRRFPAG